jgi:lipopolysaccharide/colanic/teichoic acid biosynthesis glycosyltransferase
MKTKSSPFLPPHIRTHSPVRQVLNVLGCLLALPLLCVTSFVMSVITAMVSPGPVIFRQRRIGYHGREFMIYKFRTMYLSAGTAARPHHPQGPVDSTAPVVKPDTRMLPFGWFLRASGLAELPQIINVIRGEMSLVGPRPWLPAEFDHHLPEHRERTNALPGLTGLSRVSGKITPEEMTQLDIHYVRHASVLLDLKIVFRTFLTLAARVKDSHLERRDSAPASRPILRSVVAAVSRIFKSA